MRSDITVRVVSDFGASQDFQAFRIAYSGYDPALVAQVTNRLADLFIEGSLTARQNQATGTTEFLTNQLQETRKALEQQRSQAKGFQVEARRRMPAAARGESSTSGTGAIAVADRGGGSESRRAAEELHTGNAGAIRTRGGYR